MLQSMLGRQGPRPSVVIQITFCSLIAAINKGRGICMRDSLLALLTLVSPCYRGAAQTERSTGARIGGAMVALLLLFAAGAPACAQDSLFSIRPPANYFIIYNPQGCRISLGYPKVDEMGFGDKLVIDQSFQSWQDASRAVKSIELCLNTSAAVQERSSITLELACDRATSEDSLADQEQIKALANALNSSDLKHSFFRLEYHTNVGPSDDWHLQASRLCADRIKRVLSERFGVEPTRLLASGRGSLDACSAGQTICSGGRLVVINLSNSTRPR